MEWMQNMIFGVCSRIDPILFWILPDGCQYCCLRFYLIHTIYVKKKIQLQNI